MLTLLPVPVPVPVPVAVVLAQWLLQAGFLPASSLNVPACLRWYSGMLSEQL
jgi:hypothetical protein